MAANRDPSDAAGAPQLVEMMEDPDGVEEGEDDALIFDTSTVSSHSVIESAIDVPYPKQHKTPPSTTSARSPP